MSHEQPELPNDTNRGTNDTNLLREYRSLLYTHKDFAFVLARGEPISLGADSCHSPHSCHLAVQAVRGPSAPVDGLMSFVSVRSQRSDPYDAIVVGSGITGGLAAKELCERGLRTLVVERGRHVEHGKDYLTEWLEPWELEYRGRGEPQLYARDYPIQSRNYAFGEATKHFFVNDREHPYISEGGGQDFRWIRGYHLGGRSVLWGRGCLRWG